MRDPPPPRELHRGTGEAAHDPSFRAGRDGLPHGVVPDHNDAEWMKDCAIALARALLLDIVPCGDEWTDVRHRPDTMARWHDADRHQRPPITDAELANAPDNMMYEQGMHTVNHRCITLAKPLQFGTNIPVRAHF